MTNFRLFWIKRLCRRQFQIWRKWQKVIQTGRKHCGKRRNCSLRAISPFPTVFSKGLFPRGVKRCSCVGMLHTIFFPSHWLLSHIIIIETMDNSEKGMNPVAMTILNPRKEYWPSWGSNQRLPVLKSATLLTELWDSAWLYTTRFIL